MDKKILELEKSLFKYEYMSNIKYLDDIIDDNYTELGKSGKMINKEHVINELNNLKSDRKITIYNYSYDKIAENIFLVHYITKSNYLNIYRTSIWKKNNANLKILFHQASEYKDEINLIEY